MLKDIKLPLGVSLMELSTLMFFVALGYLCIYRFSFYNTLGISWYFSSITPTQILTSSFNSIFSLIFGGAISVLIFNISKLFKTYRECVLHIIFLIILVVWGILMLSDSGKLFPNFSLMLNSRELSSTSILHYVVALFMLRLVIRTHNTIIRSRITEIEHIEVPDHVLTPKNKIEKYEKQKKEAVILLLSLVFMIVLTTPFTTGHKDALFLLKNREHTLNLVKVKSSTDHWYLIEMAGDKILLINKNESQKLENDFKLIEYKDVENIAAPQKRDMDQKILNYLSSKVEG